MSVQQGDNRPKLLDTARSRLESARERANSMDHWRAARTAAECVGRLGEEFQRSTSIFHPSQRRETIHNTSELRSLLHEASLLAARSYLALVDLPKNARSATFALSASEYFAYAASFASTSAAAQDATASAHDAQATFRDFHEASIAGNASDEILQFLVIAQAEHDSRLTAVNESNVFRPIFLDGIGRSAANSSRSENCTLVASALAAGLQCEPVRAQIYPHDVVKNPLEIYEWAFGTPFYQLEHIGQLQEIFRSMATSRELPSHARMIGFLVSGITDIANPGKPRVHIDAVYYQHGWVIVQNGQTVKSQVLTDHYYKANGFTPHLIAAMIPPILQPDRVLPIRPGQLDREIAFLLKSRAMGDEHVCERAMQQPPQAITDAIRCLTPAQLCQTALPPDVAAFVVGLMTNAVNTQARHHTSHAKTEENANTIAAVDETLKELVLGARQLSADDVTGPVSLLENGVYGAVRADGQTAALTNFCGYAVTVDPKTGCATPAVDFVTQPTTCFSFNGRVSVMGIQQSAGETPEPTPDNSRGL